MLTIKSDTNCMLYNTFHNFKKYKNWEVLSETNSKLTHLIKCCTKAIPNSQLCCWSEYQRDYNDLQVEPHQLMFRSLWEMSNVNHMWAIIEITGTKLAANPSAIHIERKLYKPLRALNYQITHCMCHYHNSMTVNEKCMTTTKAARVGVSAKNHRVL